MMVDKTSPWLPIHNFGPESKGKVFRAKYSLRDTWQKFWKSVPNNANSSRSQEIHNDTKDLNWQYLGDGKTDIMNFPYHSSYFFEGYYYLKKWGYQGIIEKTIRGNYRKENKVQIWIGTMKDSPLPQENGFYKIIYDPANEKHTLSQQDKNANVIWSLGFSEDESQVIPMAINYK
jgi:hypothetical protein